MYFPKPHTLKYTSPTKGNISYPLTAIELFFLLAYLKIRTDFSANPGKHRTEQWKQEVSWDLRSWREFLPAVRTHHFNEIALEKGFAGAFSLVWTAPLWVHTGAETWTSVSHIPRQMSQWFNYQDSLSPSVIQVLVDHTKRTLPAGPGSAESNTAAQKSGNSVGMWEIYVQLPTYLI